MLSIWISGLSVDAAVVGVGAGCGVGAGGGGGVGDAETGAAVAGDDATLVVVDDTATDVVDVGTVAAFLAPLLEHALSATTAPARISARFIVAPSRARRVSP